MMHIHEAEDTDDKASVPVCRKCSSLMILCFAIPYKEFVCPACRTGVEFFNGNPKRTVLRTEYDAFVEASKPALMALYEKTGEGRGRKD